MSTRTVTVELPEELLDLLGPPERIEKRIRNALVFDLLRDDAISQGRAARLLHITRWELSELMAKQQIPSALRTMAEARAEIETAKKLARQ